jgi:hypothetical protein
MEGLIVRTKRFQEWARIGVLLGLVPMAVMPAAAQQVPAYGLLFADGYFQRVDLRSGLASRVGSAQAKVTQALAFDPAGNLYGVGLGAFGSARWALFRIAAATGESTSGAALDSAFGELVTGLTFDSCGKLWAVTASSRLGSPYDASLIALDPVTGTPTVVGPLGLAVTSVAALGNQLYGLVGGSRGQWGLARIDRTTGKATLLGALVNSFGDPGWAASLAFDGIGRLWAIAVATLSFGPPTTSPIALFDPTTGASTPVAGSALAHPQGLAIAPPLGACAAANACVPSSTNLCLGNLRFAVRVSWQTAAGGAGSGQAVPLTGDTGSFWFFDAGNLEVLVKVIDGCAAGGHHWVFAGGLTNVAVTLTVADLQTETVKTYDNRQGQAFLPIQDTSAFAGCP